MAEHMATVDLMAWKPAHYKIVIPPDRDVDYAPLLAWMEDPDQAGVFAWAWETDSAASARTKLVVRFSDPDVALAFKMRWG